MFKVVRFFKYVLCLSLLAAIGLTGCARQMPYSPPSRTVQGSAAGGTLGAATAAVTSTFSGPFLPIGAVVGAIAGGAVGNYMDSSSTFTERLRQDNIQIVQIGDTYTVVLPSDKFFVRGTSQINPHYLGTLDEIVRYIRHFDKIGIKVSGYSDNTGPAQRNLALTQTQAQHIMHELWNRGVDARIMYARGYGACNPISSNKRIAGRRKNRRIEITVQRIPHIPVS